MSTQYRWLSLLGLKLFVIWSLFLTSACVTDPRPDIPQDAIVTYETVELRFKSGEEAGNSGGFVVYRAPLVGDPSTTRLITMATIAGTNQILSGTMFGVELLIGFPTTESQENYWRWQHDDGQIETLFELNRAAVDEPNFTYTLQKRFSGGASFLTTFEADFERLADSIGRIRQGQGRLNFYFDNGHLFEESDPTGEGKLTFRSYGGVRQVVTHLDHVINNKGEESHAVYRYAQYSDESGWFEYSTIDDFFNDGEPLEDLSIATTWLATGEGRAAVLIKNGSLAEGEEVLLQECWGSSGVTLWLTSSPTIPFFDGGTEAECAQQLQGISLSPPDVIDPATTPDVPAADEQEVP